MRNNRNINRFLVTGEYYFFSTFYFTVRFPFIVIFKIIKSHETNVNINLDSN